MRILVAEDDPASRELLTEMLLELGYEVIHARDGLEALEQAEAASPDLILLDIQMPRLDGFGVIERLRRNPKLAALPVVALTAYAMGEDRLRTRHAGFDDHIAKPLEMATLRALLEQRFGASSPRRQKESGC